MSVTLDGVFVTLDGVPKLTAMHLILSVDNSSKCL